MFYGVSHIDIPVTDLARARRLWSDALGFPVRQENDDAVDVDAASLHLRLIKVRRPELRVSIRVQSHDVEGATAHLQRAGATLLSDTQRTPQLELSSTLKDDDGNQLVVWRALTEDEYGFDPALPIEGRWLPQAERLLQTLLKRVPGLFRGLARRKIVRVAEDLALKGIVDERLVVRAYIQASSRPTRYRTRDPIREQGYNPDDFAADFDA